MTYTVCVATVAACLGIVAVCNCKALEECPPVDDRDANATLLANVYNCSTFYICRQGTPLKFECPADLHFNDRLKVCDYRLNASCVPLTTQEPPELVATDIAVTDLDVSESASISVATANVDGVDVVTAARPVVSTIAGPAESNSDDVDHSLASRLVMAVTQAGVLSAVVWLDLVVALTGLELHHCESMDDMAVNTTLPAHTNCSAYYRCKEETHLVFSCLAKLPSSGKPKECDHQVNADCGQLPTSTETPPESVTTGVAVTEAFEDGVAVKQNTDHERRDRRER